jgi:hypothetical protein
VTYQWFKGITEIGKGQTYKKTVDKKDNQGVFKCVATNADGKKESVTKILTVECKFIAM